LNEKYDKGSFRVIAAIQLIFSNELNFPLFLANEITGKNSK
jgi:hypothetical protein